MQGLLIKTSPTVVLLHCATLVQLQNGAQCSQCRFRFFPRPNPSTTLISVKMAPKTWLVTGCSSGFGAEFVLEALRRGDKAVATGRGDVSRLSELKDAGAYTYSLDVTALIQSTRPSQRS